MTSPQSRAILALLFTMFVWGIGPVFLRSLSVELGPADHLAIRYTLVTIIYLTGLAVFGGWRIAREDWPRLLAVSIIGMVGYNLGSAFGFARITAGMGSLIIGTQPLLIAALGTLIARERLHAMTILGLVTGFSGTALLVWKDVGVGDDPESFLLGSAFIFLCGVAWAFYVVLSKPLIQKYGSYSITALSIAIATLVMVPLLARPSTLDTLRTMSMASWFDMAYIGVLSTVIATITWNFGAARMPAAVSGAFLYLVPIVGVAAGAVLLGETVTPGMLTGGALILAGVGIAQFGPRLRMGGRMVALLAVIFAVTMWGLIPVAMRFLILDLSPPAAILLRLYPAGLLAIVIALFVGVRRISWPDWGRIAIAALAGNVGYQILAAWGMQTVPASWTGLLFGLEPVFIALFAVLLAGDRLNVWLVAGIAVAIAGTVTLMLGSVWAPSGDVGLLGLVLVTLSTMGWGIYTVVIRPVSAKYGAFPVACLAMGLSAIPTAVFITPDLPQTLAAMTAVQWLAVGYVVIFGTFLATAAWNFALGHMDSTTAGVFLYVQPVVAAIGGILLLDEVLSWPLLAGGALIILGVAVAQFGPALQNRGLVAAERSPNPAQ